MLEIGLSTCGFSLTDENFEGMAKAGIKHIEISRGWLEYPDFDFNEIKRLSDTYGVNLWSFHLPFADPENLDISSRNEEIRNKTIKWWCENIEKAAKIGIKIFVAHPSSEPLSEEPEIRRKNIEAAKKSLRELADFASKYDAIIAVEDLPRTCLGRSADELCELINADNRLCVCLDTNHMLIDNNLNLIEKLGNKIVTLHISDYDFVDERHWLPGEGKIEWQKVHTAILSKGYKGPWLYEILLKTPDTIHRIRDIEFHDFYDNAMQIFKGEKLELLG